MKGDLIHNLELPLTPDGDLDLAVFNKMFQLVQERLNAIEGRGQASQIRDDLSVLGGVSAAGPIAGTALTLGRSGLSPSDPSLAPTVDTSLAGQALLWSPTPGGRLDLLSHISPLTWSAHDEFLGSAGGSGLEIGDLGWALNNATNSDAVETGHPGVQSIVSSGGDAAINLGALSPYDISYFAAVTSARGDWRVGLLALPLAANETSDGFYFSYNAATSAFWRTVTRSGGNVLAQNTAVPFVATNWLLLEMVVGLSPTNADSSYVDFFINRTRAFRHTGVSLTTSALFPTIAFNNRGSIDRVVLGGLVSQRLWT